MMDDKAKISSLCWFLSMCSKARLVVLPFDLLKSISDAVHCRDVHSAPAEAFFCTKLLFGNPCRVFLP